MPRTLSPHNSVENQICKVMLSYENNSHLPCSLQAAVTSPLFSQGCLVISFILLQTSAAQFLHRNAAACLLPSSCSSLNGVPHLLVFPLSGGLLSAVFCSRVVTNANRKPFMTKQLSCQWAIKKMAIFKPIKQVHLDDRDTSRVTGDHAKCSYVLYETIDINKCKNAE